jgi:cytochrome d ubiquinol oxidase subunit II
MLATLLALVMLACLIAYAVLAGADFGAGIWDLVSRGDRQAAHRQALARAIGPVWEANHVWLIFLVVILFTCFPDAYARASVALFWPLHLVLIGIVLRGASFVFRAYASSSDAGREIWGSVFGASSAATPVLLGACLGAVSSGDLRAWMAPFPLMTGVLALLISAYLAAVYLAWETSDPLIREDFRRRAIAVWWIAGAASIATLVLAFFGAPRLWLGLVSWPGAALVGFGALVAPVSYAALRRGRLARARVLGAAQVVALLVGWAVAQWPYLIFPELTVDVAAAPHSTLQLTAVTLPFGLAAVLPSLWLLFKVFKGGSPASRPPSSPAN